jgi:hypothetical protein
MRNQYKSYSFFLLLIGIIEVAIIIFHPIIAAYSICAFAIIVYGLFFYRFIWCWFRFFRYLKTNYPDLYNKYTFKFLGFRIMNSYAIKDKLIIEKLDMVNIGNINEIKYIQKYFIYCFILFTFFSIFLMYHKFN